MANYHLILCQMWNNPNIFSRSKFILILQPLILQSHEVFGIYHHKTADHTQSNLGLIADSQLNMANHVSSVCCSCYFQLRQLRQVRGSLTTDSLGTLIRAFISSHLDYCNSLCHTQKHITSTEEKPLWLLHSGPSSSSSKSYCHHQYSARSSHAVPCSCQEPSRRPQQASVIQ
jgi:hypothetical protein